MSYLRKPHRWGYQGTFFDFNDQGEVVFNSNRPDYQFFANRALPKFIPYTIEMLGTNIFTGGKNQEVVKKEIPPPVINDTFVQALQEAFSTKEYSFDEIERLVHSHGQTTSDEVYRILYKGTLPRVVDMVFYCTAVSQATQLIALAKKYRICLIPYGGGTSVSNALLAPTSTERMVVSVDTRGMNSVEWIDAENMTASIQAGINGQELEHALRARGYTMGHEPDSIEFSTLGGWISTNASGMKRNRYGNIEDIVQNVTLITTEGVLKQVEKFDRVSMGMQVEKIIFGSEGNLGIITSAVVRIQKRAALKRYQSVLFRDFSQGIAFLKAVAEMDSKPASVRLVDNAQFRFGVALRPRAASSTKRVIDALKKFLILKIKKFDPHRMCLATIVMEGSADEVRYQNRGVVERAQRCAGVMAGAHNGKRGYILTHVIAYIRDFLMDHHCIGETMETTVPWTHINSVCRAFHKELLMQHTAHNLPGKPYLSYRITQLYHGSVCIYFMFGLYTRGIAHEENIFASIERKLRHTILENGGSISHHHGVGKLRQEFVSRSMSPTAVRVLRQIKRAVDPHNVFGVENNVFRTDL